MNPKSPRFALFAAFLLATGLLPNESLALKPNTTQRLEKDISPVPGWGLERAEADVIHTEKRLLGLLTPSHAWTNWAGTQFADPAKIFNPKTVDDLIAIVTQAKAANKKVRAAGTGHSWSTTSVVNQDGYMADIKGMNKIYNPTQAADGSWTVEVETGVTLKELDDLLRKHSPPLAVSSNVVIEQVRYGGVMALGCHGAATNARTMTDLVTQVKIVDSNGTLNTFTKEKDPVEFSAAGVNLGLLGMIYSYTMKVEPMFNLRMVDTHPLVDDFFNDPKVGGPKIRSMVLRNDQTQFFYWPFNTPFRGAKNDHLWIKEWQRTNATASDTPLKDILKDTLNSLENSLGKNVYDFMAANPPATPLLVPIMYQAVSADKSVVLHAPNAIHYRAGIEHVPCLDLEMLFKVDANFENVVKAWRYVIDEIYAYAEKDEYPINLTMEMRFIKSSSMIMSPAYDEDPEAIYCAIEIVSIAKTKGFDEFSAKVAKYWMDNFQANPHWAKMWEHVPGIVPYLRQKAGTQYDTFETIRKKYDPNGMFMTGTFAGLLGH